MRDKTAFDIRSTHGAVASAPIKIAPGGNDLQPSPEISPHFFILNAKDTGNLLTPIRDKSHQQLQPHKLPTAAADPDMFLKQPVPQQRSASSALTAALSSSTATSNGQSGGTPGPDLNDTTTTTTTTPTQSAPTVSAPSNPVLISSLKKAHSTDQLIFAFSQSRRRQNRRGGSVRFDLTESQENLLIPLPPYVTRDSSHVSTEDCNVGLDIEDDMSGGGDDDNVNENVNDYDDDGDVMDGDMSGGASTHAFCACIPSRNPLPVIPPHTDKQSTDVTGKVAGAPQSITTACGTDSPQHTARNDLSRAIAVAVAVTTSLSRPMTPAPAPAATTSITSTAGREPTAGDKPLSLVLPAYSPYTPCGPRTTDNNTTKDSNTILADHACALVRQPVAVRSSAFESSSSAPESPEVDSQSLFGLVTAWSRVWTSLVGSPKVAPSPTPGSTGTPTPEPQLPRSHPSSSWFAHASSKSSTKSRGSDRRPWTLSSGESGKSSLAGLGGLRASNKFSMKLFPSSKVEGFNQSTAAAIPIPSGAGAGAGAVAGDGKMSFTAWIGLVGSPPSTSHMDAISRRTDNATTYTMGTRLN